MQAGGKGSKETPVKKGRAAEKKPSPQQVKYGEIFSSINSEKPSDSMIMNSLMEPRNRGFIQQGRYPLFTFSSNQIPSYNQAPSSNSEAESSSSQVYFGTNVNPKEIQQKFRSFINSYKPKDDLSVHEDTYYLRLFKEINETRIFILNIDGNHLYDTDKLLYRQLICFPNEVIPLFDYESNLILKELTSKNQSAGLGSQGANSEEHMGSEKASISLDRADNKIMVRITNLKIQDKIRDLRVTEIDKLICFSGIVIRTSEVIPEMKTACFRCTSCRRYEMTQNSRNIITEPIVCLGCGGRGCFELVYNESLYGDKQLLKVQELPSEMSEGETPLTLQLCAYDELVDYAKPGDVCLFVGIYRAQGIKENPNRRVTKSTYRTYIDIVSISKYNSNRMTVDDDEEGDEMEVDEEKINNNITTNTVHKLNLMSGNDVRMNEIGELKKNKIKEEVEELKKRKDIYDLLVDSLAPNIWENDDVKKGLLLQLFGGVNKDFTKTGQGKFRGDINVLLIGDPSTAKSQLLSYVHDLAPRGIYTSGKGSSVVGLTAYVTKDPESHELILESGALVLSDKGVCCIDEFDKMDDGTKVVLHEAMEQQTISIAKAGIICQLNARSAILASANPIESKYNPKRSVIENINLPPAILSRFDLIYLMLDQNNEIHDRKLANHIISLYGNIEEDEEELITVKQEEKMEVDSEDEGKTKSGKKGKNQKRKGKSTAKKTKQEKDKSMEVDIEIKPPKKQELFIRREVLSAYISEARKQKPIISDEIVPYLITIYTEMRKSSNNAKKTITATPRQLESIIRLSEAMAKLRFSPTVDKEDVDEAVRLIKVATQQTATDPNTGVIDMDLISTGYSSAGREKLVRLKEFIRQIMRDNEETSRKGVKFVSLRDEVKDKFDWKDQTYNDYEFHNALRLLEDDGFLALMGNKRTPTIRMIAADI